MAQYVQAIYMFIILVLIKMDVLLLLIAFRDQWKEWGDSNFQLFAELPVPPLVAEVFGTLTCVFLDTNLEF